MISQVVHLCVQSRPGDGGEHSLAAVRAFRGRPERQGGKSVVFVFHLLILGGAGDTRLADEQVQGLWVCHHDKLRGGTRCHSGPEMLSLILFVCLINFLHYIY